MSATKKKLTKGQKAFIKKVEEQIDKAVKSIWERERNFLLYGAWLSDKEVKERLRFK